jgi:hypothetical protein
MLLEPGTITLSRRFSSPFVARKQKDDAKRGLVPRAAGAMDRRQRLEVRGLMFEVTVKLGDRLVQKFRGHGETNIGRDPGCELMLDNLGVSRRHAQLREVEGRFIIEDKNSTNGVFVNGQRINSTQVQPGDEIKIGKFTLEVRAAREESPAGSGFDVNQTIAIEGMAIPDFARREPKFAASVTRDVFHTPDCNWIKATPPGHKVFFGSEKEAIEAGKRPCKTCIRGVAAPRF